MWLEWNKQKFICFETKNYLLFKNQLHPGTEFKDVQQSFTSVCFHGTAYKHMVSSIYKSTV
jgi:hypothetical protein